MIVVKADTNRSIRRQFELVDPSSAAQRDALIAWLMDVLPTEQEYMKGGKLVHLWKEEW